MSRTVSRWMIVVLTLAVLFLVSDFGFAQRSGRDALSIHQQKHRELHQALAGDLRELAEFCRDRGMEVAAAEVQRWAMPVNSDALSPASLPVEVEPEIPLSLPRDERYWQTQLRRLRSEHAKELYLLSRRALHAGYPSYAYRLVREVAHFDPDHKSARRLLGYVRRGDEWVTPFAAQMINRRHVWHDEFGWIPKAHVERYENGERQFNRRWMSAAQEAELRRDFKNAWEIRTEHFLVKTNHSLERGVEVAKALEDYYQIFFQTFAGFFNTPEQMQKLFEGASGNSGRVSRNRPFEVHYYRTRDEYNRRLVQKIPQIAITNGLYYTSDRISYFYHDPDEDNEPTLFHEATHQMFYESETRDRLVADDAHFWIVEGIACYMESFRLDGDRISLGDPDYIRFEAARYRLLEDNYYIPLVRFTSMGMQEFQTAPNISKNYSQSSGLAHFFMHYDGGRYRDALVEHLSQIYSGRSRRSSSVAGLDELTGVSYAELDRQYGEYMRAMEQEVSEASGVESVE